jgi:hypothetical protein
MASRSAASTARRIEWAPQPRITGVLPVVRRGRLVKHSPQLTESQTRTAAELLKKQWPSWQHEYVRKMAEIAGIAASDFELAEHEQVRYRFDGKTPMIDLPRIRTFASSPHQCDQRNCVALCLDKYSSKIWTRVGMPENSTGCALEELREVTERYRSQAALAGEWFCGQFFDITESAFRGTKRIHNSAILEVTTVGLRVEDPLTEEDSDAWLFDGNAPNLANEELCEYLAAAANIQIEELEHTGPDSYWMAMPNTMLAANGMLVSRRVLYLSRTAGDVVQIVGIGLDDSGTGEMANDVALKLSRLIANWI